LDPGLKFELLVISRDHVPLFTKALDPAKGEAVTVTLKARDLSKLTADHIVHGRVVDEAGDPVKNATVSPEMVWFTDWKGGAGGMVDGLDPLAVTDEHGDFALSYFSPCGGMDLEVNARGYAKKCVMRAEAGATVHTIRVIEGAAISGRLTLGGKPVAGVEIGLCPTNRTMGSCFDHYTIATDKMGRFTFVNLTPEMEYVAYAMHDSAVRLGAAMSKPVTVKKNGEQLDLGDMPMVQGRRVVGRLILPEGKKIPPGSKISLNHDVAWDSVIIDLPPDGRFEFVQILDGQYSLNVTAPGLYLSPLNASYLGLNHELVGKVDRDILDLEIEMVSVRPPDEQPNLNPDVTKREIGGAEVTAIPQGAK
jgi:hypothetical protein